MNSILQNQREKPMHSQQGMSLMSLLVSINLSMFAILTALSLFTGHRMSANEATVGSEYTSQLAQSRLYIEKEIMNAGFGIPTGSSANIVIDSVNGGTNNRILWKYTDNSTTICRGIRDTAVTIKSETYRHLAIIQDSTTSCAANADLGTLGYLATVGTLGKWPVRSGGALETYITNNGSMYSFTLNPSQPESCSPFGALPAHDSASLTINAPSFAEINRGELTVAEQDDGVQPGSNAFTICLPNP